MARRYETDELLFLRDSPLVVKPDNLPPVEEWMGPILESPTQKKHNNSREQANHHAETTNRRPSFFESRHISRASNSEDIVLGPPKTAFASATRGFGKPGDGPERTPVKSQDHDDTKHDRQGGFRDKFFKDKEHGEWDRDFDKRDGRPHLANGRRTGRDDKDDWIGGRPRRTFGQDDNERKMKRGGDPDRWDTRDFKDHRDHQEHGSERTPRDKDQGRFTNRRDPQVKGRHDQPWFRDDVQDSGEHEEEKTPVRNREWRRGLHGQEREWTRPVRHEQDPEWMDTSTKPEPKESHTQEDFQRWKERMKTGAAASSGESRKEATPAPTSVEAKPSEPKRVDGEMFSTINPSMKSDAGLDNFFGLWGESKANQDLRAETTSPGSNVRKDTQPTSKPGKASRFAGFFNAPAEVPAKESESTQPASSRPISSDADQEGFQRILQLLGGNKSRTSTPQAEDIALHRGTPPQAQTDFIQPPTSTASPLRENRGRQEYMGLQESAHERPPPGLEHLLSQKTPKEGSSNPDTEFLLRLMQQSKISPSHHQMQAAVPQAPSLQNPSAANMFEMQNKMQDIQKQKSPIYLDDPAIANMHRPEASDPRNQLRRRVTGGPAGYFDEMPYPAVSSGNHTPTNIPGVRSQHAGQPPMGIQRPPGLEQIASPGWPNPQVAQGGSSHGLARPGAPNPPNRGMNPNYPPGPPMSMPSGIPPPPDRQQFQRGSGAGGPPGFAPPPPGIMPPPPGHMNMNAPPPSGFPPMPPTPDGPMGMPHGHPAAYGAGPPHQTGNSSRQVIDLINGHSGGGGGPGAGPPSQPGSSSRELIDMLNGHGGGGAPGGRNGLGMMGPGGPYR